MSPRIISEKDKEREKKREYWTKQIGEWKESGLSQTDYCQRVGVKYNNFKWWRWKLKKKGQFLAVRVIPEEKGLEKSSEIEIRIGPLSVIAGVDFEEDLLRRVIKSLEDYHA